MAPTRAPRAFTGPPQNSVKWLADENFDNDIIRGVLRRSDRFEIVRVLTHDLSTMIPARREQLRRHSVCTPIVLVPDALPVGVAIEEIILLNECSIDADWEAGVIYLP